MKRVILLLGLAGGAHAEALNDYVVKPGDSCAAIARKVFGDARQWRRLGEHHPEFCGPKPGVMLPGTVLRLPWSGEPGVAAPSSEIEPTQPEPATADAQVTTVVQRVEAKAPDAPDWVQALRGTDLFRGWRVSTGDASAAELTFRDQSVLQLRQNALVIIYGQTAQATRRPTSRARLERGELKSRLAELAGELTVETEAAETLLGPGVGLVSVDAAGASLVARHEGTPAVVKAAGARVEVPAGTGSKIAKGQPPSPPTALPPTPTWAPGPSEFGPHQPLTLAWSPVEGAARYRIEISRRADGGEPVASAEFSGPPLQLSLALPPGRYQATLAVLDATGFEGRPSAPRALALSPALIELPGGGIPSNLQPFLVPVGTRIVPPEGFRCGLDGQPPAEGPLVFTRATVAQVTCTDAQGEPLPGTSVRVEAVRTRVIEAPRRIKRGQPVTLRIRLESKAPLPTAFTLQGPPELTIDEVLATGPGEYTVTLRPQASVVDGAVRVLAKDTEISHFTLSLKLPP